MAEEVAVAQRNSTSKGQSEGACSSSKCSRGRNQAQGMGRRKRRAASGSLLSVFPISAAIHRPGPSTKRSLVGGIDMDACAFCGTRNCTRVRSGEFRVPIKRISLRVPLLNDSCLCCSWAFKRRKGGEGGGGGVSGLEDISARR